PRVVNVLCDHCLLIGYADQKRKIDPSIVEEAIEYLEEGERPKPRGSRIAWTHSLSRILHRFRRSAPRPSSERGVGAHPGWRRYPQKPMMNSVARLAGVAPEVFGPLAAPRAPLEGVSGS